MLQNFKYFWEDSGPWTKALTVIVAFVVLLWVLYTSLIFIISILRGNILGLLEVLFIIVFIIVFTKAFKENL